MEKKISKRQVRLARFRKNILPALLDCYEVKEMERGTMYKFADDRFGKITMYPMADKLMLDDECIWVNDAALWIIRNIFMEDDFGDDEQKHLKFDTLDIH